jgi:hypothetical protein
MSKSSRVDARGTSAGKVCPAPATRLARELDEAGQTVRVMDLESNDVLN